MAKKVSITRELMSATNPNISRQRKSEPEQAYFNRIVLGVDGLSDDVCANLFPDAQAWYASAAEAINKGEMIPSPIVAHHQIAEDDRDDNDEDSAANCDRRETPTDRREEKEDTLA